MRKPYRFYNLNRPKLRQSWNKHNLYNLQRRVGREPMIKGTPTFFQQKWAAKSKTRAYHGEHVPEKKWVQLFSRRLLSAVDLPPRYLAEHDGSEQAAGRGSGLTTLDVSAEKYWSVRPASDETEAQRKWPARGDVNRLLSMQYDKMTPYMQMAYAPLERRLDTAIFRALFASSVRQARQFVIHGAVKVNGKKMVHPSYQLNPGDMFQVEVEKVLYGTGAQKQPGEAKKIRTAIAAREKKSEAAYQRITREIVVASSAASGASEARTASGEAGAGEDAAEAEDGTEANAKRPEAGEDKGAVDTGEASLTSEETPEESRKRTVRRLRYLVKEVKKILKGNKTDLTAKEKIRLRTFRSDVKRFLSQPAEGEMSAQQLISQLRQEMSSHELLQGTFQQIRDVSGKAESTETNGAAASIEEVGEFNDVEAQQEPRERQHSRRREVEKSLEGLSQEQKEKAARIMGDDQLSREEMRNLTRVLKYDEENPIDDSKPYATPWRPRPYMGAFAFVPRYLEVNPNICAAVYLRHPVARKGMAEVPTPFSYLTSQLAHNWYLGRG